MGPCTPAATSRPRPYTWAECSCATHPMDGCHLCTPIAWSVEAWDEKPHWWPLPVFALVSATLGLLASIP